MSQENRTASSPTKRHWWTFGLRNLMLLVTLLCLFFAWFGVRWREAKLQAEAVEYIQKCGGNVIYDCDKVRINEHGDLENCDPHPSLCLRWFPWLGKDFSQRVLSVELHRPYLPPSRTFPGIVFATSDCESDRSLLSQHLEHMPYLQLLQIDCEMLNPNGFDRMPFRKNLVGLKWEGLISEELLKATTEFSQLRKLSLEMDRITLTAWYDLSKLSQLESITVENCNFPATLCNSLKNFPGLKKLVFHSVLSRGAVLFTDADLLQLGTCPELEELELGSARLQGHCFQSSRAWPKLRRLIVSECPIDEIGMQSIAQLPQLQYLELGHGNFTIQTIADAEWTAALQVIHLHRQQPGDSGLRRLARIPSIRQITAEGVSYHESTRQELLKEHPGLEITYPGVSD